MADKITEAVKDYLDKQGKKIVADFRSALVKAKKVATKKLYNSIESEVSVKDTRVFLKILANEEVNFLGGRKKGYADVKELEDWAKVKNLNKGNKTPEQTAWAIAKTIQKEGVKGKNIKKSVGKKADALVESGIDEIIQKAIEENIEEQLQKQLQVKIN